MAVQFYALSLAPVDDRGRGGQRPHLRCVGRPRAAHRPSRLTVIVPAWMSHAEARRGPLSLFNDIVWGDVTGSGGFSRTFHGRRAAATFGADIDVDYSLAIVEAGGAYTV